MEESLTELAERGYKRHVYKIDDGTGTLTVVHAAKRSRETDVERAAVLEQASAGSSGLGRLSSMAEKGFRAKVMGFDIGDCLCVTGRFRSSNKTNEVVLYANHVQKAYVLLWRIRRSCLFSFASLFSCCVYVVRCVTSTCHVA